MQNGLIFLAAIIGLIFLMVLFFISRYRRCPSDKILVIYGKTGGGSANCIAGGAKFVWPVIQDYEYLDLTPISIDVDLQGALSKQNIRVSVPSRFTVGISNEPGIMLNAAERLLGRSQEEIKDIAKDIIFGQLRLSVATMDIEEINADRDKFLSNVSSNVGSELSKIGLHLINVNVTDIQDESGYIEALGKEAAAKAINDAKISVSEKNRDGSIGEANAYQDQRIKVASAEALAQVGEAEAQANATKGQNEAQILIAQSNAERREREAEAEMRAASAEKIQSANTLAEAYKAEQEAEVERAKKELATREADIIVKVEIEKRRLEIEAEAQAEQHRRIARGEADAILMKKEAEAKGLYEILKKQADGFDELVKATGGSPKEAVLMLIADKLPELVKTQVEAIKGINIDKVTVWEGGGGQGEKSSTANFISGLYKSVPPLKELFNMAGMDLPDYLGKEAHDTKLEIEEAKNGQNQNKES